MAKSIAFHLGNFFTTREKYRNGAGYSAYSDEGAALEIVIRNRAAKAITVKLPFYTKKYKV